MWQAIAFHKKKYVQWKLSILKISWKKKKTLSSVLEDISFCYFVGQPL